MDGIPGAPQHHWHNTFPVRDGCIWWRTEKGVRRCDDSMGVCVVVPYKSLHAACPTQAISSSLAVGGVGESSIPSFGDSSYRSPINRIGYLCIYRVLPCLVCSCLPNSRPLCFRVIGIEDRTLLERGRRVGNMHDELTRSLASLTYPKGIYLTMLHSRVLEEGTLPGTLDRKSWAWMI